MSHEIELKLALGPDGPERLCHHSRLVAYPAEVQRLTNTYFDTPQGDLEAAHLALRLRRRDHRWVQTLKTRGSGAGGLSRRGEWEWPVAGPALDRKGLAALPPMAALGSLVLDRLTPRFTTDFERRVWQLGQAEATIEVALDIGEIRAGSRAVPIRELELELKGGDPEALWALAAGLAETIPLRPADASKAARGAALLTGRWSLPAGSHPIDALHRAIMALDALADTGDDRWRTAAIGALQHLAEHGEADAALLASALAGPHWLTAAFGQGALRLARRLTPVA
jgi:triphosphatase